MPDSGDSTVSHRDESYEYRDPELVQVTIAVPTYRRPEEIARLLPHLVRQGHELERSRQGRYLVTILIVDNDAEGSARDAAAEPVGVHYVIEPRQGIAAARNRALSAAAGDVIVFIDDDEEPAEEWLSQLIQVWERNAPAAVAGRVAATFERKLDPWVEAGDFWERPRMATGTAVPLAATGNLLLDLNEVRRLNLKFEEAFALGGGEDIHFTKTLTQRGGRILWCEESIAYDRVPRLRTTKRWVLRRAWSHGNVRVTVALQSAHGLAATVIRVRMAASGSFRVGWGILRAVWGLFSRSQRHQARGLRTLLRGAGMVSGSFGHRHQHYVRAGVEESQGGGRSDP